MAKFISSGAMCTSKIIIIIIIIILLLIIIIIIDLYSAVRS